MSNPFELVGTIKVIGDVMTFASGFTKRECVITSDDDYPQDIKFTFIKERGNALNAYKIGDKVKVSFRIRGNCYKERYFVDLDAFKLEKMSDDGSSVEMEPTPANGNLEPADSTPADSEMPF